MAIQGPANEIRYNWRRPCSAIDRKRALVGLSEYCHESQQLSCKLGYPESNIMLPTFLDIYNRCMYQIVGCKLSVQWWKQWNLHREISHINFVNNLSIKYIVHASPLVVFSCGLVLLNVPIAVRNGWLYGSSWHWGDVKIMAVQQPLRIRLNTLCWFNETGP